jgi:outer membrane protein assembly factor BamB
MLALTLAITSTDAALAGDCPGGCDDGLPCTIDICVDGVCMHIPDDALCDDGFFCNGLEYCDPELGCQVIPLDISDGIDCTVDTCDEDNDVVLHTIDPLFCDDGQFCNGQEYCDPELGCQVIPIEISDGIDCTVDSCDEVNDIVFHTIDPLFCDDGDDANGMEYCDIRLGGCQSALPEGCIEIRTETNRWTSPTPFNSFGRALAIDANVLLVTDSLDDEAANNAGAVYVFDVETGAQAWKLVAADATDGYNLGSAVALSGTTVIAGAPGAAVTGDLSGCAYLFDASDGTQTAKLLPDNGAPYDQFGRAVDIDDGRAVVGSFDGAYVFDVATGLQLRELTPALGNPIFFGRAVALSGTTAVIGAYQACYVFDVTTGVQLHQLQPFNEIPATEFGAAVATDGTFALVGASNRDRTFEDTGPGEDAGAVYLYNVLTGAQLARLVPSDNSAGDRFGTSVALSGNTAIIGAVGDGYGDSGSAYLFEIPSGREICKLLPSDVIPNPSFFAFGRAVAIEGSTIVTARSYASLAQRGTIFFHGNTNKSVECAPVFDSGASDPPVGQISGTVNYEGDIYNLEDEFPPQPAVLGPTFASVESGGTIVDGITLRVGVEVTFAGEEITIRTEEEGYLPRNATGKGSATVAIGQFIFTIAEDSYFVKSDGFSFQAAGSGASIDGSFVTAGDYKLLINSPFADLPAPGEEFFNERMEYFALVDTCPIAADLTGPQDVPDGNVDALDYLLMISQWSSPCFGACTADITGPGGEPDGNVDALDFLMLIGHWGSPAACQ